MAHSWRTAGRRPAVAMPATGPRISAVSTGRVRFAEVEPIPHEGGGRNGDVRRLESQKNSSPFGASLRCSPGHPPSLQTNAARVGVRPGHPLRTGAPQLTAAVSSHVLLAGNLLFRRLGFFDSALREDLDRAIDRNANDSAAAFHPVVS